MAELVIEGLTKRFGEAPLRSVTRVCGEGTCTTA